MKCIFFANKAISLLVQSAQENPEIYNRARKVRAFRVVSDAETSHGLTTQFSISGFPSDKRSKIDLQKYANSSKKLTWWSAGQLGQQSFFRALYNQNNNFQLNEQF